MKKKKLSSRQKAINRIQRRLNTKVARGEAILIKPSKKNIEEIFKENGIKVNKNNINDVVNDVVRDTTLHFKNTKGARKALGVETAEEARALSGSKIHDILKSKKSGDADIDIILEAYGYGN